MPARHCKHLAVKNLQYLDREPLVLLLFSLIYCINIGLYLHFTLIHSQQGRRGVGCSSIAFGKIHKYLAKKLQDSTVLKVSILSFEV